MTGKASLTLYEAFLRCLKKHPNDKEAARSFRVNKREARKAVREMKKMGWQIPSFDFGVTTRRGKRIGGQEED